MYFVFWILLIGLALCVFGFLNSIGFSEQVSTWGSTIVILSFGIAILIDILDEITKR